MNVQVLAKDGKPEWAIIPFDQYEDLISSAEMLLDIQDYDQAKQRIADGEEMIPSEVVYALVDGQNRVRVWREYRGLTQQALADQAEISKPYLSQIESGKRTGTAAVLGRLAAALNLDIDDLID